MNPNIKAFIVAASLMVVPLLPAGAQQPGQNPPQGTPTTTAPTTPQPAQGQQVTPPQDAAKAQAQGQAQSQPQAPGQTTPAPAPGTPEKKVLTPEQAGLAFTPPQGWKEGDPKGFNVPGDICCAWSPDNVASVVVFVQNVGQPYSPRVLLEQSAQALEKGLGAEVKQKEVIDVSGMRAFSLVVTGNGNGAAIDGKGTVRTTQHWVAIPRDKDIVIFLMNSPETDYAKNDQVLQGVINTLKVTGQQSPEQRAAK
ncbi:MAG: hypothetical protein QOF89_3117 [Acidobacteriota bacterium]|jgi:hypothetical protein|nr:hypothetical protein [Acidobacteriota bacterium]